MAVVIHSSLRLSIGPYMRKIPHADPANSTKNRMQAVMQKNFLKNLFIAVYPSGRRLAPWQLPFPIYLDKVLEKSNDVRYNKNASSIIAYLRKEFKRWR